jgi:hypothetical protein
LLILTLVCKGYIKTFLKEEKTLAYYSKVQLTLQRSFIAFAIRSIS